MKKPSDSETQKQPEKPAVTEQAVDEKNVEPAPLEQPEVKPRKPRFHSVPSKMPGFPLLPPSLPDEQVENHNRQQAEERQRREAEEHQRAEEKLKVAAARAGRRLEEYRNRLESRNDGDYEAFEAARVRLDMLHTKYAKKSMTKDVVSEFTKSLRDPQVLRQVKYIVEVEGDWVPGLVAPDYKMVPISEVWQAYKRLLQEMVEKGEGGFDFQQPPAGR